MKKKQSTYEDLMKMAVDWGVQDVALFKLAAEQYAFQHDTLIGIKKEIQNDDLMTTKEYVKGRKNVYAHPLVKEIPKHSDSVNKTANMILDIITRLGHEPQKQSKLEQLMNG